jgi:hypothetical protein
MAADHNALAATLGVSSILGVSALILMQIDRRPTELGSTPNDTPMRAQVAALPVPAWNSGAKFGYGTVMIL